MKGKVGFRLLVLAVIAALLGGLGLAAAQDAPAPAQGVEGGAPAMVSYQGQVLVSGSPHTGNGHFKFAIVDSAGETSFWSNDGTSTGGSEPAASVPLTVSQGLFNVLLGDTTLGGMTQPLSAGVFSSTDCWLRTWFSGDGETFVPLSPDRRIAAMPYALQAEEAVNADTLDGLEGSAYQQRVGGTCAVGSTIRAINADGTVVCQLDAPLRRSAPPQANVATVVDPTDPWAGEATSITIGADGLPVVSYCYRDYDSDIEELRVLHCGDAACTAGNTITTVDTDLARFSAITIGADGLPVISYVQEVSDHVYDLKVTHCGDAACTAGNTVTVLGPAYSDDCPITIGADGLPVVSYTDVSWQLVVAHCGDAACTTGNTVTALETYGVQSSITIGADGLPVVSYWDWTEEELRVLHCGDAACTTGNSITTVDLLRIRYQPSITIGRDGLPAISYYDDASRDLKVAHCGDAACTTSTVTTVDSAGEVGAMSSITIGADGLPVVSYADGTNSDLKVLHCGNAACTAGNAIVMVDSVEEGSMGRWSSITIGTDGLPAISYQGATNYTTGQELKVLHCSNAFCVPYWRRR